MMEHSLMGYSRGEIHLTNFNPAKGGEMGKLCPALSMSGREENDILDTIIVIPLSTVIEPMHFPTVILFQSDSSYIKRVTCVLMRLEHSQKHVLKSILQIFRSMNSKLCNKHSVKSSLNYESKNISSHRHR